MEQDKPLLPEDCERNSKKNIRDVYFKDIDLYEKKYKPWHKRGDKTIKRFRDERPDKNKAELSTSGDSKYNILWSNFQTMLPNVYARLPQPEVSRRYKDKDHVGRVASLILERSLEFEINNSDDYQSAVRNAVEDRLLPGRGIAFVRYDPVTKEVASNVEPVAPGVDQAKPQTNDGAQVTEDTAETREIIDTEKTPVDYVAWKDFGHNLARTWEEVTIVWRKVPMTRAELTARFGDVAKDIPLDMKVGGETIADEAVVTPDEQSLMKGIVYEVWDKKKKRVVWLSRQHDTPLDIEGDMLGLDGFWPCPKPLYATTTTDSLIPIPDFTMYQDQVNELDILSQRISGLAEAVKVSGVYDSSQAGIKRMFKEGVNATMVPVENWLMFAEAGGIRGSVEWFPLDQVIQALDAAYRARNEAKQAIYEIMGISDILRGASDPNETLGAQQMKGQFASKRLKFMQNSVARFATGILKIKAQIICKHYQPETIKKISGVDQLSEADLPYVEDAIVLLKNDVMSDFRIEISSDSLIEIDEQQEKQDRLEFLKTVGIFIDKASKAPAELSPLLGELLLFGVRGFKIGKTIEGKIEEAIEMLVQKAQQPQEAQPDPNQLRAQTDQLQIESAERSDQAKQASADSLAQQKLANEQELARIREENKQQGILAQIQSDKDYKEFKANLDKELAIQKAEIEAKAKADTNLAVAKESNMSNSVII